MVPNNEVDAAIQMLKESSLSDYAIAKGTGITAASIGNWRKGKARPMATNAQAVISFLSSNQETPSSAALLELITSQQETIKNLSETIKNLTSKHE